MRTTNLLLPCLVLMLGCGGSARPATATAPAAATASATPAAQQQLSCPDAVLQSGKQQGGACMEPAVLGEDVAKSCEAYLQQHGWQHDETAEQAIGAQTQKTLRCYRAPGSDGP